MNSLIITPSFPIGVRAIDPTRRDNIGGGALALLDQWARPKHEFILRFPDNDRQAADALYAFYLRHRGSTPFLFDGAGRCEIVEPQVFFVGDGTQTDFFLPFENLLANTWVFYSGGAVRSDWTMDEASGLVTWTTAPAANEQIAGKGKRWAKCVFWGEGDNIYSSEEFTTLLFRDGITLREVP